MSNYFMLECYMPPHMDDIATLEPVYFKGLGSWRIGRPFTKSLPDPIEIKISEGYPDDLKEFYYNDAMVMTKRLYSALLECGIDNMDVYRCVISNDETGFTTDEYVAVNLIGLIQAADLSKSNVSGDVDDPLYDMDFDGVEIDDSKTQDALMFRLAENTSAIMIHHTIKEYLVDKGFDMLTFVEPKDWIG